MSHYEERLEKDLENIRGRVRDIGESVTVAVRSACTALAERDRAAAARTIVDDMPINRASRALDRECHFFVARHLPSAGILRFISSVLRLSVALERIGDYAATVARETVQLEQPMPETFQRDLELMAEQSIGMLKQSLKAFIDGNAELARGTMGMAAQVDTSFDRVFADLLEEGDKRSRSLSDLFAFLVVFNRIERISDQAKNICEETVFAVTGETKEPKTYRILFVDERNDCWSRLAEGVARKAFPKSGIFASAGWQPAGAFDSTCIRFMETKGLDAPAGAPANLPTTHDGPGRLPSHRQPRRRVVGASRRPSVQDRVARLGRNVLPADGAINEESLAEAQKKIAFEVRELMEKLRGAEAD